MTRIDFYVLPGSAAADLHRLACRLADKAYQRRLKAFVNASDAAAAAAIDELLWTFRDQSFVPHARHDEAGADAGRQAVLIGAAAEPTSHLDLLINLAPEVPPFFSRFERVAELIDADDGRRRAGRERFRFYRDRGYPIETHKLA